MQLPEDQPAFTLPRQKPSTVSTNAMARPYGRARQQVQALDDVQNGNRSGRNTSRSSRRAGAKRRQAAR